MKKSILFLFLSLFIVTHTTNSFASFGTKAKKETSANPNTVTTNPGDATNGPSIDEARTSLEEFKKLSGKAKKDRFKEIKKMVRQFKADKKANGDIDTNTLLLVVLGILIPPLAVYLHQGSTNNVFWINVLLTVLGYLLFGFAGWTIFLGSIPGIVHALIVILGNS